MLIQCMIIISLSKTITLRNHNIAKYNDRKKKLMYQIEFIVTPIFTLTTYKINFKDALLRVTISKFTHQFNFKYFFYVIHN